MIKTLLLVGIAAVALAGLAHAGPIMGASAPLAERSDGGRPVVRVDWQDPVLLPPRFRNHCRSDWWGRPYCENHCGRGYEFYFCSPGSFGCCHVGYGYCDWHGHLRCHP